MQIFGGRHRVQNIRNHGACGWQFARARTVEERPPEHISVHQNSVVNAVDMAERVALRHHVRLNQCQNTIPDPLGVPDQFHRATEGLRNLGLLPGQTRNPLDRDLRGREQNPEGQRRKNHDLARRVQAFYVGGRVCLGIAAFLRLGKRRCKSDARLPHLGQNEVGRSVENPADRQDAVGGKIIPKRTDDRNSAAHARFKQIGHAVRTGNLQQFRAKGCHHLLVGGHHALPCLKRRAGEFVGGVCTAHHFGNHTDFRVGEDRCDIVHHTVSERVIGEFAAIQNVTDIDFLPRAGGEKRAVFGQHLGSPRADHAKAEQSNSDHRKYSFPKGLFYIIPQNRPKCNKSLENRQKIWYTVSTENRTAHRCRKEAFAWESLKQD